LSRDSIRGRVFHLEEVGLSGIRLTAQSRAEVLGALTKVLAVGRASVRKQFDGRRDLPRRDNPDLPLHEVHPRFQLVDPAVDCTDVLGDHMFEPLDRLVEIRLAWYAIAAERRVQRLRRCFRRRLAEASRASIAGQF
jgi:hypothetical protein